jgi:hypothetical protein
LNVASRTACKGAERLGRPRTGFNKLGNPSLGMALKRYLNPLFQYLFQAIAG